MTGRHFVLAANPAARGGAADLAAVVAERITDSGAIVDLVETAPPDGPEPVPGLADLLQSGDVEAVLAVGGDGTVRTVAEALARAGGTWPGGHGVGGTAASVPPLGIVPGGTGNSMYRALWADLDWQDMLDGVLEGRTASRAVDLYRIIEADRAVLLGASTGFFCWTLEATTRFPDLAGRELYLAAGAAVAEELSPYTGAVEVDGVTIADGPIMLAAMGGAQHRSGTIHILPGSELDDGLLDVCVLAVGTREEFFGLMGKAVDGAHVGEAGAVFARGRTVRFTSTGEDLPFEHDGEVHRAESGRVTVEVVPGAVDILVPEPGRPRE